MIDIESIWDDVARRAPAERRIELGPLRTFLAEHESPHAKALSGRTITGILGAESGESLESSVIARIKDARDFTKHSAADWLRLLYDAQKTYLASGGEVDCLTRLALQQRPLASPFSPQLQEKSRPVTHWREGLDQWMARLSSKDPETTEWLAGMALSAVLYGGLIDTGKLVTFTSELDKPFPIARGRPYLEFHQKFGGLGDFHCQRWFVDSVTELLGYRRPREVKALSKSDLGLAIQRLLEAEGVPKALRPRSVNALVEAATAEWFGRSSRVDVEVIRRGVVAHGFHDRTWKRLFGAPTLVQSKSAAAETEIAEEVEVDWRADVILFFPWWLKVQTAIEGGRPAVDQCITTFRREELTSPEMHTYLSWIEYLLDGHNATRKRLSVTTIFGYVTVAIPVLLSLLGQTDPSLLAVERLTETYEEAMAVRPPDVPGRLLAKALREFHSFLSRRCGIKPLDSIRDVLGDDAGLEPVDANVLTIDEYFAARAYLDQLVLRGRDPTDVLVAKLVMILAFRGGLRRMEIFGLRLIDVSSIKHLELLIREHSGRRLKTQASRRVLPIRFLMTGEERRELRRWIARRHQEEKASPFSEYLFALPQRDLNRVSSETVSDRIIEAICHPSGHSKTKIHQLRHSFGTWLYLALRAPDYPGIVSFLDGAPRTRQFVAQGSRLRSILGIGNTLTSRTYAYAVARLLGHSSPMVSLGHYIHSSEFFQYHIALNQAKRLSSEAFLGLTRLKPIWGGRLLARGMPFCLAHVRRQHSKRLAVESVGTIPVTGGARIPAGRKPKTTPEDWIPLRAVHGFLNICAASDRPPREIAEELGIPQAKAESLFSAAQGLSARFRIPTIEGSSIPDLPFPRGPVELAWESEIEARLKRAFALSPESAMAGVMAHLRQFTSPKGDVVFRGKKEREAFEIYTEFLRLMELRDKQIEVVNRSLEHGPVPRWAKRRLKILGLYSVRRVGPPVINETKSYALWIGLLIRDEHSAHPMLTRSLMLLTAIARGL